jgi:predicted Zn-dependent protease
MRNRILLLPLILIALSLLSCSSSPRRSGALHFISVEEELSLSKMLNAQANNELKIMRNQRVTGFFDDIGKEIGAMSDWSGLDFRVHIVNEPDINHFSLPGGSIFLYRGLIELSENAAEVALIIAHEVAHIAARNSIDRVALKYGYAFAAQSLIGENPEIPNRIIAELYTEGTILDYPEDQEFSADRRGVKVAWKSNYDPQAMLGILEKIHQAEAATPLLTERLRLTHPSTATRLRRVRPEIARAPRKSALRRDIPEFQEIKELLQKIPK